jgi:hypothetical protein
VVTYGLNQDKIEGVLSNAFEFLRLRAHECNYGSPCNLGARTPFPHPKAIIYGLLEFIEGECRAKLKEEEIWLNGLEDDISKQRDPDWKQHKGLERVSIKLNEANVRLGQFRAKLQYLLSSIATIEYSMCDPGGCSHSSAASYIDTTESELKEHFQRQWSLQLCEVNNKLLFLRAKCQQDHINIETLQHRADGYRKVVSIV